MDSITERVRASLAFMGFSISEDVEYEDFSRPLDFVVRNSRTIPFPLGIVVRGEEDLADLDDDGRLNLIGVLGSQSLALKNNCSLILYVTDYILSEDEKKHVSNWSRLKWTHNDKLEETIEALGYGKQRDEVLSVSAFPIWHGRVEQSQSTCFVLMPFGPEWADEVYEAIRTACDGKFRSISRADEHTGLVVMQDIWLAIQRAELIIADLTGKNANVFYELGIAHTLGRRTILLSQNRGDIPFDVGGMRHILYKWNGRESAMSLIQKINRYLRE